MGHKLWGVLIFVTGLALGQEIQPTIRVEVKSGEGPVQDAEVAANGHGARTGPDGMAILPAALGRIDISVTKQGFFPARTSSTFHLILAVADAPRMALGLPGISDHTPALRRGCGARLRTAQWKR
jgi:hypothetical protein